MKIKSYIYCFVALALVGCNKGEAQSPEATEKKVEMQFTMGTKASSGNQTFRFLATNCTAGVNPTEGNQKAGTYRQPTTSKDDIDPTTGEMYSYLIPCAIDNDGVVTDDTFESSYGLYCDYSGTHYNVTAVSPAVGESKESITPIKDGSTLDVWGMTTLRAPEVGKEIYISTTSSPISLNGPTMEDRKKFTYNWGAKNPKLKEPRATLTLQARAVSSEYHIKSITYNNVADKAQFHPKSGFVVNHTWYNSHEIFTSTDESDDLDITVADGLVTIPYKNGTDDENRFPLLAHDYSVESEYISAPELVVVFNMYKETGEFDGTRTARVALKSNFEYQTYYTMELTLKSATATVTVAPTGTWDDGGNHNSNIGNADDFWSDTIILTKDDDWDSVGGDITGTIE